MSERTSTAIRAALQKAADDGLASLKELSELAGRNHAYLQQYVKRGTPRILPEDVRAVLADKLGGDPDDFKASDQVPRAERTDLVPTIQEEIFTIPIYDISAAAGAGSLVEDGAPIAYYPFREQLISKLTRTSTDQLAVITVSGDSMWETLHDGDNVLVDRTVKRVVRDGIYILLFEGELLVKRCSRNLQTKAIRVKSDNPVYEPFDVTDADSLDVIGRVIWIGRALG